MKTLEDVLEEIRPAPDPDFVADMERRMKRGFPRERKRRLPALRLTRPVAALAAGAGLAVLVAVAVLNSEGGEPGAPTATVESISGDTAGRATEPAPPAREAMPQPVPTSVGGQDIAPSGGGQDIAPGTEIRRIERSAQLTLAADPDDFDGIADSIFRTAARRDGFVLQSSFTQGEEGFSNGFFELRVPAAELQPTLNELARLATVRARGESGTDVTGSFVSIRDRLRTARALRSESPAAARARRDGHRRRSALTRRLEIVGNRIAALRDQLRDVRERTEYATIFVELVDKDAGAVTGETDEAVDDAVGSLEDILNFLIRAAAILLPARARRTGRLAAGVACATPRTRALAGLGFWFLPKGSDTVELLSQVPLFAGLAPDDVAQLADVAVPRSWSAGEVVFREGDEGDTCYVVRSGAARVTRNH